MSDHDFYWVAGCVVALCGLNMLHTWMIGRTDDAVAGLRADVDWLKDNTVANNAGARA
jgi:hypothetical protein